MPYVIDIAFKSNAGHEYFGVAQTNWKVGNGFEYQILHVKRHGLVSFGGKRNEIRFEIVSARLPRQIKRVDQDAMAANSGSGIERHIAKWFRCRRIDNFPHIYSTHSVTKLRKLVDERDIDRPENIFEQLFHFGHFGTANCDDVCDDLLVSQNSKPSAIWCNARSEEH